MFDLDLNSSHERQGKQAELEQQHLERAITIDEFLEHIGNQDLNSLRYYKDEPSIVELGPINIKRPYYTQESWRYVKDPTDPGKFIDMDHFLANADLHSDTAGIGLLVEIQQLLKRYPSAFAESDYRSNALGSIFGTAYYGPDKVNLPLKDYLIRFFDHYRGTSTPKSDYLNISPPPAYARAPLGSFNNPPPRPSCPLVLDLDGDGVELTTLAEQIVRFDMDMDGLGEATGWVKADDGLLVFDRNGDGLINDLSELFGTQVIGDSGFKRLQPLDTNGDGWISAADADFASLQVWRDLDQDGMSDNNELFSLNQLEISRINVTYITNTQPVPGQNTIVDVSTYERVDGTQRQIVDVWFALDQLNSSYDFRSTVNSSLTIPKEIFDLPTLQGYGNLPDLTIAMAKDGQLLNLVRAFTQQMQQGNYTGIESAIQAILYQWAGVNGVVTDRGSFVDARKLAFLEKFLGQIFLQGTNPWAQAGAALNTSFDDLFNAVSKRLISQTLNSSVTYDVLSDRLTYKGTVAEAEIQFLQRVEDPTSQGQLEASLLVQFLKEEGVNTIVGGIGNDTLNGQNGNDFIVGRAGNDNISAGNGNDTIDGGMNDDSINGGAGNDFVNAGDGDDQVWAGEGIDIVEGGIGNDLLYLNLSSQTDNLLFDNLTGGINLANIITATGFEQFSLTGGSGNDRLIQSGLLGGVAHRRSDYLDGGLGNDTLNAGLGLNDTVTGGDGDDLLILDYSFGDTGSGMTFITSASPEISGSASRLTTTGTTLDSINFSGINRFQITGTSQADTLDGGWGNDSLLGGAGNDYLHGNFGADTLDGGDGDDVLRGMVGDDITWQELSYSYSGGEKTASLLIGGAGNDTLLGSAGDDTLLGGIGNDSLHGHSGNDSLNGGDGQDILDGSIGNDTLEGGNDNDSLDGGWDHDSLNGGSGNDSLNGNFGNDTLVGGAGDDTLLGSWDDDTYYFSRGDGNDIIHDFGLHDGVDYYAGNDTLVFGSGIVLSDLVASVNGSDLLITISGGIDSITIRNFYAGRQIENFSIGGQLVTIDQIPSAINGTAANDNLIGTSAPNIMNGYAGNDFLSGNDGNDTLNGGDGDDTLDGGTGNDVLTGGTGNDSYIIDSASDVINETSATPTEIDSVTTTVTYTLGANLENLTLTGSLAINGTGNTLNNLIVGNSANNVLDGGAGNDSLIGNAGNDSLTGGDGADTLDGGAGNDSLIGGIGNDSYFVDSTGDTVTETSTATTEIDSVTSTISYTLGANLENLTLGGSAVINGTGNSLNNFIIGNSVANNLVGASGNDTLDGAAGNDTLSGDDGNDSLLGGAGNDSLSGGLGDDILNGGTGADTLIGGTGNDSYFVDSTSDVVTETSTTATEIDSVTATVTYTLGANLENLTLEGSTAINGTGNTLNNQLTGNAANNLLSGLAGNDTLSGAAGNDTLDGGDGNDSLAGDDGNDTLTGGLGIDTLTGGLGDDILMGGAGNDLLTGSGGSDRFLFDINAIFSASTIGVDRINDFLIGTDKVVLDKTTFTVLRSIAGSGFSVAGDFASVADNAAAAVSSAYITYSRATGSLFYNQNGSAAGLGTGGEFATLSGLPTLTAADFMIQA